MCSYTISKSVTLSTKIELFTTDFGLAYQCDHTSKIIFEFKNVIASFKIQDFLNFRRLVNSIDIRSKLFDLSDESDFQFIEAPRLNLYEKLTLCELIQLRDLINGAHFSIELNSLIHTTLYQNLDLAF